MTTMLCKGLRQVVNQFSVFLLDPRLSTQYRYMGRLSAFSGIIPPLLQLSVQLLPNGSPKVLRAHLPLVEPAYHSQEDLKELFPW